MPVITVLIGMKHKPTLLILDDERYWLKKHKLYFEKQGFICIPTLFSEDAIHLGTKLNSIKYAIIDHILYDPTQPKEEQESQRWQGKEVISQIRQSRPDIKFAIITQALSRYNTFDDRDLFLNDFSKNLGKVWFSPKFEFETKPIRSYRDIKDFFCRPEGAVENISNKVLIWASDPADQPTRLNLGPEIHVIKESLKSIEVSHAKIDYLDANLKESKPHIVHFCGHGSVNGELFFENSLGKSALIPMHAFTMLLKNHSNNVRCVVLNACYTAHLAKVASEHIDYVIGMSNAISQDALRMFSKGFYMSLKNGEGYEVAFKTGCNFIHNHNNGYETSQIPVLFRKVE